MSQKVEKVLWLGHFALGSSEWPQNQRLTTKYICMLKIFFQKNLDSLTKVNDGLST